MNTPTHPTFLFSANGEIVGKVSSWTAGQTAPDLSTCDPFELPDGTILPSGGIGSFEIVRHDVNLSNLERATQPKEAEFTNKRVDSFVDPDTGESREVVISGPDGVELPSFEEALQAVEEGRAWFTSVSARFDESSRSVVMPTPATIRYMRK